MQVDGGAAVAFGNLQPAGQSGLRDPEAARDLSAGLVALTGDRDHVSAELLRIRGGHDADPSSEEQILTGKESTELRADPNYGCSTRSLKLVQY